MTGNGTNDQDIRLRIQALIDNELSSQEIEPLLSRIESSYEYRREYVELKRLASRMRGLHVPEPSKEWYDGLERKLARRLSGIVGRLFFFGSYVALLGYALYTFLADSGGELLAKLLVGGIVFGFLVLLGVTVGDRIRESKTDRYKGVTR